MNWEPIETAPKDQDKDVLLFYPRIQDKTGIILLEYVSVGCWCREVRYGKEIYYWSNQYWYIIGMRHIKKYQPTHWCEIIFPKGTI